MIGGRQGGAVHGAHDFAALCELAEADGFAAASVLDLAVGDGDGGAVEFPFFGS